MVATKSELILEYHLLIVISRIMFFFQIAMLLLHYNGQKKLARNIQYPSPPIPIISNPLLNKLLKVCALCRSN